MQMQLKTNSGLFEVCCHGCESKCVGGKERKSIEIVGGESARSAPFVPHERRAKRRGAQSSLAAPAAHILLLLDTHQTDTLSSPLPAIRPDTMRQPMWTHVFCALALFVAALDAADNAKQKPATSNSSKDKAEVEALKIEVLYKPDECENKSKKSDTLTMHYKGTLVDGTQFDSR